MKSFPIGLTLTIAKKSWIDGSCTSFWARWYKIDGIVREGKKMRPNVEVSRAFYFQGHDIYYDQVKKQKRIEWKLYD